jgi:AcrR family transcriptional regulator
MERASPRLNLPARPTRWGAAVPHADEQHRLKREALLRTAARLFNEQGYLQTSLADVAQHLGVTKPALYYYFRSKEEILLECQRMGARRLDEAIALACEGDKPGIERLRGFMASYVAVLATDFGACVIRNGPEHLPIELRPELVKEYERVDRTLRSIVEQGIADGSIAPCDARMSSFAIFGAMHWMWHWYRADGELSPAEIAGRMAEVFVSGLAPRAPLPFGTTADSPA